MNQEISVRASTSRERAACPPSRAESQTLRTESSNPCLLAAGLVSSGLSQVGSRQERQLNGLAMPVRYDHLVRKMCSHWHQLGRGCPGKSVAHGCPDAPALVPAASLVSEVQAAPGDQRGGRSPHCGEGVTLISCFSAVQAHYA